MIANAALYYSTYCEHSKRVLQKITRSGLESRFHFFCVDKRAVDPQTKKVHIFLPNGKKIVMPNIDRVPALMLIADNYRIIYGDDILRYLEPTVEQVTAQATRQNMEPLAASHELDTFDGFSGAGGGGGSFVSSDRYSYVDASADEMESKSGMGGARQMHHYASWNSAGAGLLQAGNSPYPSGAEAASMNGGNGARNRMNDGDQSMMKMLEEQRKKDDMMMFGAPPPGADRMPTGGGNMAPQQQQQQQQQYNQPYQGHIPPVAMPTYR